MASTPNGRAPATKHAQLREALAVRIEQLPEHAPLPPERELAESNGVSRQTVRQALQRLAAEGLVYRRQGSGTYVASRHQLQALELGGAEGRESRLIGALRRPAGEIAGRLGLASDRELIEVSRLRLADGEPVALERVFVEAERFDARWGAASEEDALSDVFRDSHGLETVRVEQEIEAVAAAPEEADLLGVPAGAPLLLVDRRALDSEGRPASLARILYRGDRHRLAAGAVQDRSDPEGPLMIRPARPADAPAMARIFVRAWRRAYPGVVDDTVLEALDEERMTVHFQRLIELPEERSRVLLALRRGRPSGFTRFGRDPDEAASGHVFSLYVSPSAAGQGVGRTLLEEALAELGEGGHRVVTLWVFEANGRARGLYEGLGFRADGGRRVEDDYGAQEVRLRRTAEAT
ncbi:MAG TPA: GNAT family N-acetyltransferase [Candidatus Dormibacteraeota bacterium]|jgi:GntR family transcriptional regulator|nr:GNAT family N-acetyltransferase [Candidatus Dormibacteraeota bacterium]